MSTIMRMGLCRWTARGVIAAATAAASATGAGAAWSSDPATNLSVADAGSDQVQPKLALSPDGRIFVSWFDGIASGYDVRIQKLDVAGEEIFAHNGELVANRSFSSTQDYGLSTLDFGDAVLTFRDDRFSGIQITASRIASSGATLWGPNGVQLTSTTDFVAAPAVAGTSDGSAVVAWTQASSARVMRLDGFGMPAWAADVVFTPASGAYSLNDIQAVGPDVIVSLTHETGGFGSPRRLYAQKIAADGSLPWGTAPIPIFTTGSLQFGNFPDFFTDAAGNSFFTWYDASTSALQCYVQRLRPDGTPAFPANGVAVSMNGSRVRVGPSAGYDPSVDALTVFWTELNAAQTQFGVRGQRFDGSGNRLRPTEGVVVAPLASAEIGQVNTVMLPDVAFRTTGETSLARVGELNAFVFWMRAPSFGNQALLGARLLADGTIDLPAFPVASTPSGKSRLTAVPRGEHPYVEQAILAWSDDRIDSGDILAQNVNFDGSLGELVVAVPGEGSPHEPWTIWPNPTRELIHLRVPGDRSASLEIVDARGRHVRTLEPAARADGFVWDGRRENGVRVPAGVYYVRNPGNRLASPTITLLR